MKTRFGLIVILCFTITNIIGQVTNDNCVSNVLLTAYSERAYSTEPVTDEQLDIILKCGIKAPSARNLQPWKFTVIKDEAALKEIISNVVPGNVAIVISGVESESGTTTDFDCGLATEAMFVAAHGLGLGARIYGGPIGTVNSARERFQIPAGYRPVMILRIGNVDKTVDAVSAATPRKTPEEVVNYFRGM